MKAVECFLDLSVRSFWLRVIQAIKSRGHLNPNVRENLCMGSMYHFFNTLNSETLLSGVSTSYYFIIFWMVWNSNVVPSHHHPDYRQYPFFFYLIFFFFPIFFHLVYVFKRRLFLLLFERFWAKKALVRRKLSSDGLSLRRRMNHHVTNGRSSKATFNWKWRLSKHIMSNSTFIVLVTKIYHENLLNNLNLVP